MAARALLSGQEVRIYELNRYERNWKHLHTVEVKPEPYHVKLFGIEDRPALWIQPQPGENRLGHVWTADRTFPLGFTDSGVLPSADDVDVTYAGDELRVVFRRDKKLFEKRYTRLGDESGAPIEIIGTMRTGAPGFQWVTTAVMAVFTVLIISTLLRKRTAEREEQGRERDRDRDEE